LEDLTKRAEKGEKGATLALRRLLDEHPDRMCPVKCVSPVVRSRSSPPPILLPTPAAQLPPNHAALSYNRANLVAAQALRWCSYGCLALLLLDRRDGVGSPPNRFAHCYVCIS